MRGRLHECRLREYPLRIEKEYRGRLYEYPLREYLLREDPLRIEKEYRGRLHEYPLRIEVKCREEKCREEKCREEKCRARKKKIRDEVQKEYDAVEKDLPAKQKEKFRNRLEWTKRRLEKGNIAKLRKDLIACYLRQSKKVTINLADHTPALFEVIGNEKSTTKKTHHAILQHESRRILVTGDNEQENTSLCHKTACDWSEDSKDVPILFSVDLKQVTAKQNLKDAIKAQLLENQEYTTTEIGNLLTNKPSAVTVLLDGLNGFRTDHYEGDILRILQGKELPDVKVVVTSTAWAVPLHLPQDIKGGYTTFKLRGCSANTPVHRFLEETSVNLEDGPSTSGATKPSKDRPDKPKSQDPIIILRYVLICIYLSYGNETFTLSFYVPQLCRKVDDEWVPVDNGHHGIFSFPTPRVVVIGDRPEMNTILAHKSAADWADKPKGSPLSRLPILFHIDLGKVAPDENLEDAIRTQLLNKKKYSRRAIGQFLIDNSADVTILMDGLERFLEIDGYEGNIIRVVRGEELPHLKVVVTSEEWAFQCISEGQTDPFTYVSLNSE